PTTPPPTPVELATPKGKCHGKKIDIRDSKGDHFLLGTDKDVIDAREGQDFVVSLGGDDTICAGEDDDLVDAGPGNDVVYGDDGSDTIAGGSGRDRIYGEDS